MSTREMLIDELHERIVKLAKGIKEACKLYERNTQTLDDWKPGDLERLEEIEKLADDEIKAHEGY